MKRFISSFRIGAFTLGGLLMLGAVVSSCDKDDNDNQDIPAAGLLAANLAPDVNQAAITLSGNYLNSSPLGFGTYTGGYLGIYTGARPVAAFDYSTGNSLNADTTFTFDADKYYSLFLVGTSPDYQSVVVHDDFDALDPVAGKAYVRYVQAIPGGNQTVTSASGGTNVVNDNAALASVSSFTAVNSGDITVTTTNGSSVNVNRTFGVEERGVYTIFLQGNPTGTGDQAPAIKFISHGKLDASTAKQSSVSAKSTN